MTGTRQTLDGILLVDKPAGITSAGVVREVKRRLDAALRRGSGQAKVGHLGTLDPFATGLLPLAIGEGSKVVPFLNQESKAYEGTIALGRTTDSLDATGAITETASVPPLDAVTLESVTRRFRGDVEQVPPRFSALKRDGVPLYALARKGIEVEPAPRVIHIDELTLDVLGSETISLSVRCSKGTYVRSLARDVARALGTVGHLASLRRTAFGPFDVSQALPLERITADAEMPIVAPRAALASLPELEAGADLVAAIRRGQQWRLAELVAGDQRHENAKIVGPGGYLVAVVGASPAGWKILRVFA